MKKLLFQTDSSLAKTGFGRNAKALLSYLYATKKYEITLSQGEVFTLDRLMPHMLKAVVSDVKFIETSTYHRDKDSYRVYREPAKELSIT